MAPICNASAASCHCVSEPIKACRHPLGDGGEALKKSLARLPAITPFEQLGTVKLRLAPALHQNPYESPGG
jgi:hypothetical protein